MPPPPPFLTDEFGQIFPAIPALPQWTFTIRIDENLQHGNSNKIFLNSSQMKALDIYDGQFAMVNEDRLGICSFHESKFSESSILCDSLSFYNLQNSFYLKEENHLEFDGQLQASICPIQYKPTFKVSSRKVVLTPLNTPFFQCCLASETYKLEIDEILRAWFEECIKDQTFYYIGDMIGIPFSPNDPTLNMNYQNILYFKLTDIEGPDKLRGKKDAFIFSPKCQLILNEFLLTNYRSLPARFDDRMYKNYLHPENSTELIKTFQDFKNFSSSENLKRCKNILLVGKENFRLADFLSASSSSLGLPFIQVSIFLFKNTHLLTLKPDGIF